MESISFMEKVRASRAPREAPPAICGASYSEHLPAFMGSHICSMHRCVSENVKLVIEERKFIFGVLMGGCVCVCVCAHCVRMYIRFQSLAQRVKAFGIDHPDTVKQWKKLNTEYNVAAMKLLQTDDFETVHTT